MKKYATQDRYVCKLSEEVAEKKIRKLDRETKLVILNSLFCKKK